MGPYLAGWKCRWFIDELPEMGPVRDPLTHLRPRQPDDGALDTHVLRKVEAAHLSAAVRTLESNDDSSSTVSRLRITRSTPSCTAPSQWSSHCTCPLPSPPDTAGDHGGLRSLRSSLHIIHALSVSDSYIPLDKLLPHCMVDQALAGDMPQPQN